jgi:hypothetical protein
LLDIIANVCLSVFKVPGNYQSLAGGLIRVYLEASQSLIKSDGVRVYLAVGAKTMNILEAIFFEYGKKQRVIVMAKETEQKAEAILD